MADAAGASDQVQVAVLGPFAARRGDVDLPLGGHRQRAVLARIVLAGGAAVADDRIVDDVWDGLPPASARNSLQSYVSNLRRALKGDGPPAIERIGEGYRLALPPTAVDAVRFEQQVNEALAPGTAPARAVALLDAALAEWRGDALGEFADAPWAQGEAVRLEELRLAAVESRFTTLLDQGAHAVVAGDLDAAVAQHPFRERLTELLVVALYRCGRQADALRAYERTRARLAEELGLDPGPDLARLADAVLRQDPELAAPALPAPTPGASELASPPPAAATPELGQVPPPPAVTERRNRTPFVGRAAERSALAAAWGEARDGARLLAVISGEPGQGKTRLAQHFAGTAHDDGGQVLWGRCTPERLGAYQPVVEALRTALRTLGPVGERLVADHPAVARLLPELDLDLGTGRVERFDLFDSVAGLVADLGRDRPTLLVIDDLQWTDPSTVGLLEHLVAQEGRHGAGLLVAATLRRPAGRATPEVDRLLHELRRQGVLRSLDLAGLEPDAVPELLAGLGVDLSATEAADLAERTGGNPFYLEALAEHPEGPAPPTDARELPPAVRELIDQRLAALPDEAASVLAAAAVIGLRADLRILGAVAGLDPLPLLDVLDGAIATGLLVEDEELGWVAFPHALVRQAMVARTTRNREAGLHLAVADALEAGPPVVDRTAAMAQHLLAAGPLCPPERAAPAALAAADEALGALADAEARSWARRAADLVAGRDDPGGAGLATDAQLLVARASRFLGDRAEGRAATDRALERARHLGDPGRLAAAAEEAALQGTGFGFSFNGGDESLIALLDEALAALPAEAVAARTRLLARASIARNGADDDPVQRELSAEALRLADQVDDPEVRSLAVAARRFAITGPAGLDERLRLGEEARQDGGGDSDGRVAGLVLDAIDLLEAGDVPAARKATHELRDFVAPYGRPAFDAYAAYLQGSLALLDGRLAEAAELSTDAHALGREVLGAKATRTWLGQQYLLARERGTLAELTPVIADAVERFPRLPAFRAALALCHVAAGDQDAARAAYRPLVVHGRVEIPVHSTLWYTTLVHLAEVVWRVGDAVTAAAVADLLAPYGDRVAITGMGGVAFGFLHRAHGHALAGAGRLDEAVAALDRAAERSATAGFEPGLAHARHEQAAVLRTRDGAGDQDRAEDAAAEARRVADPLGMALELA